MTFFESAWAIVKTDLDFIEGVPWERRVDYIARKLADHYAPGERNEKEYEGQKKYLEREIARRKDELPAIFPTDEELHDQIGPTFYGQYIDPEMDSEGKQLHEDRILLNLPRIFDAMKYKISRENRRRAMKEVEGDTTGSPLRRYHLLRDKYDRRSGPGSDSFEQNLIDAIIRTTNHEFGHAITRDEIERFNEEIDWDDYDWEGGRSKDDPLSRHQHASEALAHIMESPHEPNWRERFEGHDNIHRWLLDEETRKRYYS